MTIEEFNDYANSKLKDEQEKFISEAVKSGFTKEQAIFLFDYCKSNNFMGIPMF